MRYSLCDRVLNAVRRSKHHLCDLPNRWRRLRRRRQCTYTIAEAALIAEQALAGTWFADEAKSLIRLGHAPPLHWFAWHLAGRWPGDRAPIYGRRWELQIPEPVSLFGGMACWSDDCTTIELFRAGTTRHCSMNGDLLPLDSRPIVWRDLHVRRADLDAYIAKMRLPPPSRYAERKITD